MGASLKPSKGPLSPRQKLVGRLAVGVLALLPRHRRQQRRRARVAIGWSTKKAKCDHLLGQAVAARRWPQPQK